MKRVVENRLMHRREAEAKEMSIKRMLVQNNILVGHGTSAARVENKRRARSEAAERRELMMDFQNVQAEQDKARRKNISAMEDTLAEELSRRKAANTRQEMDRRRICDGSEELRALKERLHMAKVNKERAQQLLEIGKREHMDRQKDQVIAEHMENERLQHIELAHKLDIEKLKQRERVKVINQQQIAMKEAQREEAMQEYLQERAQVAELVDKIAKEDEAEQKARADKQEETKIALRKFMIDQKETQIALEKQEQDEFRRIEEYAEHKRQQEEKAAAEKAEKEREKTRVLNAMLGKMEARSKEAQEFEQLRNDLHLEELEAEGRRREEMQMRKKLEDKEEMKNAYVYQMQQKIEKQEKFKREEDAMKEELMKKFAEDDRIEQMNEHKRRMKVEAHKREAERLVQLRREKFDQERQAERDQLTAQEEQEGARQVIIEQERRRLLQEHAKDLADFLPKGTLESKADYDLMFQPKSACA